MFWENRTDPRQPYLCAGDNYTVLLRERWLAATYGYRFTNRVFRYYQTGQWRPAWSQPRGMQ